MYYTAMDYRNQMNTGGYYYTSPVGLVLEPVRTTQYEIGFKQAISDDAALKVTGFLQKIKKDLWKADRVDDYAGQPKLEHIIMLEMEILQPQKVWSSLLLFAE